MKRLNFKIEAILVIIMLGFRSLHAQTDSSNNSTTTVEYGLFDKPDTILQKTLPEVEIIEKGKARTPEEEEAYQKLKRRVIKLYPYALLAKQIHDVTNENLNKMESNSDKRKYRKEKEKELRDRFENEIKALYTTDGPVLVKLIHRETGKTTYDLLRESKSWVNCIFYQMAAKHNGYSLKDTYNAENDRDIENIIQILKSEGQLPIYAPM